MINLSEIQSPELSGNLSVVLTSKSIFMEPVKLFVFTEIVNVSTTGFAPRVLRVKFL